MSKPPLHRKDKQEDAEALAVSLQTCCAYANSALVEDGISCGDNEFYYRVAEHYVEIDGLESGNLKQYTQALEETAKILDTLAEQFRTFIEEAKAYEGEDDDDERQDATKA